MKKEKVTKEKVKIDPEIYVAWFDNNHWGDRGDPRVAKLKDVDFGTTPNYPSSGDILKEKTWKNVFVTVKNKHKDFFNNNTYISYLVRVTKKDNEFYVDKERLDQHEELKEVLMK